MALTRKALTAMGIEEEKVEQIITMHSDTVTALKDEIDQYKGDAEKLPEVQKELGKLKEDVSKNGDDPYKIKYDELKEEFDKYKAGITAKEDKAKKQGAYKRLLVDAGIGEKYIDSLLKVSGDAINSVDFDDEGKVKDSEKLVAEIKEAWGDFIVETKTTGTTTATPPSNTGGTGMTKKEIMAITDRAKRREAIAENPAEFNIATQ